MMRETHACSLKHNGSLHSFKSLPKVTQHINVLIRVLIDTFSRVVSYFRTIKVVLERVCEKKPLREERAPEKADSFTGTIFCQELNYLFLQNSVCSDSSSVIFRLGEIPVF